ncbi:hypothetical protein ABE44_05345, partial [Bacillus thuringiensis]|nr:hypothetical protein [Bacillus thuringiensis]
GLKPGIWSYGTESKGYNFVFTADVVDDFEDVELITSYYTSPGFADEILYVYKATGLTRKENKAELDED